MHCVRQVSDQLFWVGANDHRLHLFENIHPVPNGVSYNSYLLLDKHTVLFDTVDWAACRQFLDNLDYLLQDRPLDYIVIHHVEPDHSASLNEILLRWPQIKLAATAKAFDILRKLGLQLDQHECITVKENDTLSFGQHSLRFFTAPMVHWPEVMLSFDATSGTLFSADAFGSFRALDGKLFSDEVNFDRDWLDETRRYYSNIVGKYGPQVQALLKKLQPLLPELKIICPLHGLVWRENLPYFLEKHDLWSKYEPESKGGLIIYASMYGNTENAAQILATQLCSQGLNNVAVYDVSQIHSSYLVSEAFKFSHIVFACVTYNGEIFPPFHDLLRDLKHLNLQNRTVALIDNGCWAPRSGNLIKSMLTNDFKNLTLLEPSVCVSATLQEEQAPQLDLLANALIQSIQS